MKIFLLIIIFLMFGCNETNEEHYARYLEQYEEDIPHFRSYRKEMLAFSKKQVGEAEYNMVYQQFLDTTEQWAKLGTSLWGFDSARYMRKLDKLICFNKTKDKLVGAALGSANRGKNLGGSINYMLGAKINGNWYFWSGANQVVSKEMNCDLKKGKPISFFQLENYSVAYVLGGYMTKDRKMNHKWFESLYKMNSFKDRYLFETDIYGYRIDDEQEYTDYLIKYSGLKVRCDHLISDSLKNYHKLNPTKLEYSELCPKGEIPDSLRKAIIQYFGYQFVKAYKEKKN